MTINQHNFEAYILDYLEGNLDALLTADLMAFLTDHPEYENLIPDYDTRIALHETLSFSGKAGLKKDFSDIPVIVPANFEEFCIADCEGLLSGPDHQRLQEFATGDALRQKTLDTYRNIRLFADHSVVFPEKSKLRKSATPVFRLRYLYYGLAVAASLLLLVVLSINPKPDKDTVALQTVPVNVTPSPAMVTAPVEPAIPAKEPSEPLNGVSLPAHSETHLEMRETVNLASLGPRLPVHLPSVTDASPMKPLLQKSWSDEPFMASVTHPADPKEDHHTTFLKSLVSRIDFWKTAENAIQGFNYLTETQLSIDKQTDGTGKVTGLMLGMESYTVTGNKIK